jgi:EAL domain-containing protein (putative c-di-GMP-specific phosphodiesterase class I)
MRTTSAAPVLQQVQLRYDALSDVGSGRLVGLQSDVVWAHPTWGTLPADDAWAASERCGQQRALRRWVLEQACRDVAALSATVGVGVALPVGLTDADTLAEDVADALAASGLAPARLVLCFPERLLTPSTVPALHAAHGLGVRLALTDYGLGTTLWGLLTQVPLDAVVVSLRSLSGTGGLERALRVLRGISEAAAEVGVRTVIADVDSTAVLAAVGALGLLAMTGPLLPSTLTPAEAAALLLPI